MCHSENYANSSESLKRSSQEVRGGSDSSGFRADPLVMAPWRGLWGEGPDL